MGLACRGLRKITMTYGIQSKMSVCLSVIGKYSRTRAACSGQGLFNMEFAIKRKIIIMHSSPTAGLTLKNSQHL